jgi:hypothetical protein
MEIKKEIVNKMTFCYTIDDIANWQKEINTTAITYKIALPSLQRGFVWKASQIESLWDSLLRGYPIGALLMNKVAEDKKELLDGQQRCTSISIGYLNPLEIDKTSQLFNIQKNIPSVWIDLKPLQTSIYGLKFGVRVLSRSHPWGYQLNDNKKPLSASDRESALNFFREKAGDNKISFSKLVPAQINPWDANYPIPLFVLLKSNLNSFEEWSKDIYSFIDKNLKKIKTKHSGGTVVDYSNIIEFLEGLYNAILRAKQVLIPEILVHKDILEEKEEHENEDSNDATLFVRLNSEGTRISGEELIYSLLKSTFPKAKELVEKIDVKFIAPSKIVNLFARLSLMMVQSFESYQKDMNLIGFRRNFANQDFKNILSEFIQEGDNINSEAKILFDRTLEIVSLNKELPKVYIKYQVNNSLNLFFVCMVYLYKNKAVSDELKNKMHKDFHSISLFNNVKDKKKTPTKLYDILKQNNFKNWDESVAKLKEEHAALVLPLISLEHFKKTSNLILDNYIKNRNRHFGEWEYVKNIFKENKGSINYLILNNIKKEEEETDEDFENRTLDEATNYWLHFSNKIYSNKTFLILAQKDYFNQEFEDFMEFDVIEDTNNPWDWDHIYPKSWVVSKHGISPLAKSILHTNGNFRALSFNENRSQSNNQSPKVRFEGKSSAQQGSFIKKNDLKYWLQLSNTENRLKESEDSKDKVDSFVYACFHRMNNIYEVVYNLFKH